MQKNTGELGGRKIHVTVAGKHCSGMPGWLEDCDVC